jgi:inorganic pyrophosphatase
MDGERLHCVIEIPRGSHNKYEYDHELDAIKLDRVLPASVVYPTDYGFVPDTLAPDGDALDVLMCLSEPTFPGCIVFGKIIGVLEMSDEGGRDDHIVCVPWNDPEWNRLNDVEDLSEQLRAEIQHFFSVYKDLDPARHSEVHGWADRAAAQLVLEQTRERFAAALH